MWVSDSLVKENSLFSFTTLKHLYLTDFHCFVFFHLILLIKSILSLAEKCVKFCVHVRALKSLCGYSTLTNQGTSINQLSLLPFGLKPHAIMTTPLVIEQNVISYQQMNYVLASHTHTHSENTSLTMFVWTCSREHNQWEAVSCRDTTTELLVTGSSQYLSEAEKMSVLTKGDRLRIRSMRIQRFWHIALVLFYLFEITVAIWECQ